MNILNSQALDKIVLFDNQNRYKFKFYVNKIISKNYLEIIYN